MVSVAPVELAVNNTTKNSHAPTFVFLIEFPFERKGGHSFTHNRAWAPAADL
jgi:hypothetical protein